MSSVQDNPAEGLAQEFARHWRASTADSNLTLHGFRRFKTTHLLNLRYLEAEIDHLDHVLYQLGLSLNLGTTPNDRLGLQHCTQDEDIPAIDETISKEFLRRLRTLLREYDEAILAFSKIMSIDDFSLLDDEELCSLRPGFTLDEKYKTRLLRVDQMERTRQDPLQRSIHHALRSFRYHRRAASHENQSVDVPAVRSNHRWSSQNTSLIAEVIARVLIAAVTAVFLTVPLVALSHESRKNAQLAVISVCVVAFACVVSVALRASNLEMMVVCAAYAAIISVFVSNSPASV